MSAIMFLSVTKDLEACTCMQDLEDVEKKYKQAFTSSVDASEFNRLVKTKKLCITMSK